MSKGKLILILLWMQCAITIIAQQPILNPDAIINVLPTEKINTKFLEFAPTYYAGGIVFVHAKDQEKFIDKKIGSPYFELMYSDLAPDGMPLRPVNFSSNIRTKFHEGPAVFNREYNRIFFTRSNYSEGKEIPGADGKAHMKIYTAEQGPEDWINIEPLPFCSDDYDNWGPAISPEGNAMVFTSNRPGGFGGMDLYFVKKEKGVWGEPVNLGSKVNSAGDEAFPYWHYSGVLFFTADERSGGLGKFDIYAIQIENGVVIAGPEHLPAPINSRWDDLAFICDDDGTSGFFASSRKGGLGKDDIYAFSANESILNIISPAQLAAADTITDDTKPPVAPIPGCIPIEAALVDAQTGEVVAGAVVTVQDTCNNVTRIFASDALGIYSDCHKPGCAYKIQVSKEGYYDQQGLIVPVAGKAKTTIFLHPVRIVEKDEELKSGDTIILNNIYYDFNKSAIRKGDSRELEALAALLLSKPDLRVELRSHTDARGTTEYNLELSERRAISALEFLVSRGVREDRVDIRAVGESEILNRCTDGVECSDIEHQVNRRTEIIILETGDEGR